MSDFRNNPQQNALQQWLDFYDRQMPAVRGSPQFGGGDFSRFDREERMKWALAQAGMDPSAQQRPDFFGEGGQGGGMGAQAKFVRPERFNDPMPVRQPIANPMRGNVENYLAKFLGGR